MRHINELCKLYGTPHNMDELANTVFNYINLKSGSKLLGWGFKIEHSGQINNSHECPHNGTTNWWGRKRDGPRHYPGWSGRIWIFWKKAPPFPSMDGYFSKLRLFTGTGGHGLYNCPFVNLNPYEKDNCYPLSYDFRFFEADWPLLKVYEDVTHALDGNKENILHKTYSSMTEEFREKYA